MVMTFVLTPWSHYNIVTEPCAYFLFSLLEGLLIDFPSHMIVSMIDIYRDTTTRDKLIFSSIITLILTHMHVPIPFAPLFSMRRTATQLASKAKQSHEESTFTYQEEADIRVAEDAAYASRPFSSSASSFSSRVEASLVAITDQLQLMRADFGSRFDHLTDEICQMNTRIGHIVCQPSRIGGFAPSPSLDPFVESSNSGDDKSDDASGYNHDDEMTVSL